MSLLSALLEELEIKKKGFPEIPPHYEGDEDKHPDEE